MGRPSNKVQRRAEIVAALLKVMAKTGYENASIQAISKEAGLTSGLVHYHFKSKQAILVELIELLNSTAQTRYLSLKQESTNAKQQLEAFIDSALALGEGANEEGVAAWVVIGAESIKQIEVREIYQSVVANNLKELQSLLKSYAKENNINLSKQFIENIAATVIGSIEGAYQLASTASEITPRNYAAKTLKSMLFALLSNS